MPVSPCVASVFYPVFVRYFAFPESDVHQAVSLVKKIAVPATDIPAYHLGLDYICRRISLTATFKLLETPSLLAI